MHYIAKTLLADAEAAINKSFIQNKINHKNLRGTLREDILLAFMETRRPYFLEPGKGTIIDTRDQEQYEGEDDVILYDKEITPAIKICSRGTNGVYHYNGVLGRIEVKSSLEAEDYLQFVKRSQAVAQFRVDVRSEPKGIEGAYNYLFGYDSRAKDKHEIMRFYEACQKSGMDPVSGKVSIICVLGKGIYRLHHDGRRGFWQCARADETKAQQLVRFVAMVSEMSLQLHIKRIGRIVKDSLEISIGNFLWEPNWEEVILT